jgi:trehalose synthase
VVRLAEDHPGPGVVPKAWTPRYEEVMRENARKTFLSSDMVMVHGLQPLGLVEDRRHDCPWLWRCYANFASNPVEPFLKRYLPKYQGAIFSAECFIPETSPPWFVIPPSIDPFSSVNESLATAQVNRILGALGIPHDRPMALQFLGEHGPGEALQAIRLWKSGFVPGNAVLVLVQIQGTEEAHDPELDVIQGLDRNVRLLRLTRASSRELSALGWAAQVVIDPTTSPWPNEEVLDVLWKGKPALVCSDSGTAPFVRDGCGYRARTPSELARKLGELLEDSGAAKEMGACAHLSMGRHHLVPRHLLDYLKLMLHFVGNGSRV